MKPILRPVSNHEVLNRKLIAGLRNALDKNYSCLVAAAHREWEGKFASHDASNTCASVRIRRHAALRQN